MSRGFSIMGSYVLSKNLDTLQSVEPGNTQGVPNPLNLRDLRGRSNLDKRHVITGSWMWNIPGKIKNPVLSGMLGGWTVTGIHRIESGEPLSFVMGTDVALDGTGGGSRQLAQLQPGATLDTIRRDHASRTDMITQFFNTSAFVPVNLLPRGMYGNAGRNILSGPASVVMDASILKDFALRETLKFQLRGEFFNVLNEVNFSNPNTNRSSSSFGRITGAGSGRNAQIALKLVW
jgi:hypothetical protein